MIRLLADHIEFHIRAFVVALATFDDVRRRLVVRVGERTVVLLVDRWAHLPVRRRTRIFPQFHVHETTAFPRPITRHAQMFAGLFIVREFRVVNWIVEIADF